MDVMCKLTLSSSVKRIPSKEQDADPVTYTIECPILESLKKLIHRHSGAHDFV